MRVKGEMSQWLTEMSSGVERLQQRLIDVECCPTGRSGSEYQKEVKYDGVNPFPMEFLKELIDIKNKYYDESEVQYWTIFKKEVNIWGCIIHNWIQSFDEFVELFTEKY